MPRWVPIPISAKYYGNLDEQALTRAQAAIENGYTTEGDGLSRFPGLKDFVTLGDSGRVVLSEYESDLMATTSLGKVYRVSSAAVAQDVTGAPVTGEGRPIFSQADDELLIAKGGKISRFDGETTKDIADDDAPLSTHIGFIDGYTLAIEKDSERFEHSGAGAAQTWDPLDVFSADGNPDDLTSMLVTQFREVILFGRKSTEQFERLQSGDTPFFRRWAISEGLYGPYLNCFADNAVFMVNHMREVVRLSGQTSSPVGDDIGKILETIDDWSDAWFGAHPDQPLNIKGQKFLVLQIPRASNPYGTKGWTFLYNIRKQEWTTLWGWNTTLGLPDRWPGWSYWTIWGRTFVGGEGKIYEVDLTNYNNAGAIQRWLVRTAPLSQLGEITIEDLRLRVKRGLGSNTVDPAIWVRANHDNKGFGRWVKRGLGKAGDRHMNLQFGGFGTGWTWQFEFLVTDDVQVEIATAEAYITSHDA